MNLETLFLMSLYETYEYINIFIWIKYNLAAWENLMLIYSENKYKNKYKLKVNKRTRLVFGWNISLILTLFGPQSNVLGCRRETQKQGVCVCVWDM